MILRCFFTGHNYKKFGTLTITEENSQGQTREREELVYRCTRCGSETHHNLGIRFPKERR